MCPLEIFEHAVDCECPELPELKGKGTITPHVHLRCAAGHEVIQDGDVLQTEVESGPQHIY